MKKISLSITLAVSFLSYSQQLPQLGKNKTEDIAKVMSEQEKTRMVVGMGVNLGDINEENKNLQGATTKEMKEKVPGAAGYTASFPKYGIPSLVLADGPAGLRISPERPNESKKYYATAFPIATSIASSWDTEVAYQVGKAMGNEVKEYGVDILLAPGMNIQRNTLGGRNFEYYSEDPLVSGKMAAAMVKGIQSNGVGTSIKHFVANNFETNRETIDVKISERALREIYLRGFEIAVKEANPWTVMSSYNKLNGLYTSENPDLITKVLRDDWKYKGFVMSDWFAGRNAVEQMKAGNNLLMPGTNIQYNDILNTQKNQKLSKEIMEKNVSEILEIVKKSPSFLGYKYSNTPDLNKNAAIAREAAAQGIVLLKNEHQTLPISKASVDLYGNYSYQLISGGTGSGDVNEAYTVSLLEGLKNAGFNINQTLKNNYETYLKSENAKIPKSNDLFAQNKLIPELYISKDILEKSNSDFAVITIARIAGEAYDRKLENNFHLSEAEQNLIETVSREYHKKGKKVMVILNIGGMIETVSWRDKVDAILLTWLPGQEAGNAITDIITGKVTPSGKLAVSFLKNFEDNPSSKTYPEKEILTHQSLENKDVITTYPEGIYVGYRSLDKNKKEVAYPFGFGLSYTDFEYSTVKLDKTKFDKTITATITITNKGKFAGKEVAELYLKTPANEMDKPEQELKGFVKTKSLQPNESQTINITLDERSLSSFDEKTTSWVAEQGNYEIRIGSSSRDIKSKVSFILPSKTVVEKVSKLY